MRLSPKTGILVLALASLSILNSQQLRSDAVPDTDRAAAAADPELSIKLDGRADEKAWGQIPFRSSTSSSREIKYKTFSDGNYIYFLAVFPAEKENRQHRLWHWDPLKQYYVTGPEQEEVLLVFWSEFPADSKPDTHPANADLWIWRSARTDPSGYADDYHAVDKNISAAVPSFEYIPDQGVSCWQSWYSISMAGDTLTRFHQRTPEGSIADVKAKGTWNAGFWTVEFARKLDTGANDDISLKPGSPARFMLSIGNPAPETMIFSSFSSRPAAEADKK